MKRAIVIFALLAAILLAGASGYVVGFRQGWRLSLLVDRPVRGAIAVALLHGLDAGKDDAVRTSLESDIDNGLLWWPDVERFPAYASLNALSGEQVVPETITYVRRIASYRRQHESPLMKPSTVNRMLDSVRKDNPEIADELAASGPEMDARMAEVIKKYGQ